MAFTAFLSMLIGDEGWTGPETQQRSWLHVTRRSSLPANTAEATLTACTTQSGQTMFSALETAVGSGNEDGERGPKKTGYAFDVDGVAMDGGVTDCKEDKPNRLKA